MKFTKMHGIGNDYVYVNCFEETVTDPNAAARVVSDRHFGIGSDGLILIKPSDAADCEMDMYNSDGSQGAMCGNGIRCVAKYVFDNGIVPKTEMDIDTKSGIKHISVIPDSNGKMRAATVNMGSPDFDIENIPVDVSKLPDVSARSCREAGKVIDAQIEVDGLSYRMTSVSMGNPHTVICIDDVAGLDIEKIGPKFENHPCFPDRVNTEFIRVIDRKNVKMRVWERGAGETLACGTGSCAVAAACITNGYTDDELTVHLLGGDLVISWDQKENLIYMTGPAQTVFAGEIDI